MLLASRPIQTGSSPSARPGGGAHGPVKPRLLPIFLALIGLACVFANPAEAQDGDLAELSLALVNEARTAEGLPPLELGAALSEAAEAHANDMLSRDFYGHVTPDGATARDRYLDAGGDRWRVVAENIARCEGCAAPADPERVRAFHSGWMQSPGHRENILRPGFDRFGFGIASGEGAVYAVQTFAGPGTAPNAAQGEPAPRASDAQLREAALAAVNAARADAGQPPVEGSEELNSLAVALADEVTFEGDALSMPPDPFALLPESAGGWTGLAVAAEACGGCGAYPAEGDGTHFASRLAESGGRDFTHFGFALSADGTGRKVAVGVFGRR